MSERPIGEVLSGLIIGDLPEGWTPLEAIVMVQCLDVDGGSQWAWRSTGDLSSREIIGALVVQLDLARQQAADGFE